jgi:hypothetical protein
MSRDVINQILGLAAIDKEFARQLLEKPLPAIHSKGFQLTSEESKILQNYQARTLQDLSKYLLQKLP